MTIDITTAELLVWIAISIFLIVIPVIFLFKKQLPYVLDITTNLKDIGLPKIKINKKVFSKRIKEDTKEESLELKDIADRITLSSSIASSTDPFDIAGQEELLQETIEIIRKYDTGEKGLIDIDAMKEQPEQEPLDAGLSGKQQQDLEGIKFAALSHKERGKLDLFEKKLVEGLAISPNNSDLLKMLADHYFESGNLVKAMTILKKIINEETDNHKAIRQIAQIYLQQNQHDTAQLLVEKAIQLSPENPKYHITMVEIFYSNKQVKSAIRSMENVLKLRPTNKNYMLTLASLHEEVGEPTKAKSYYKKILQIDPSNEVAKRALTRLSFK